MTSSNSRLMRAPVLTAKESKLTPQSAKALLKAQAQSVRLVPQRLAELEEKLAEESHRLDRGEADVSDYAWEDELEPPNTR